MQGTSVNPGLIPRTLDLLFDSLKEKLELNTAAICKFKPDKFNEIVSLTESEHEKELAHKVQLLGLAKEVAGTSVSKASGNIAKTKQYSSSTSSLVNKLTNVRVPDNKKYIIWMTFYELYNDNIYDLLEVFDPKINSNVRPLIREDKNKVPFVDGVNHVPKFIRFALFSKLTFRLTCMIFSWIVREIKIVVFLLHMCQSCYNINI